MLRLMVKDSYVKGLVLLRFLVSNYCVWGLVFTLGG